MWCRRIPASPAVPLRARFWDLCCSLSRWVQCTILINCIPGLQHGFIADDLTIARPTADPSEIKQHKQQGLDCITPWSAECRMEVSAVKTEHTLFGARETNLLSPKVGETVLKEVRAPKLLGLTMQPHKGLSKHALSVKAAADTRLMRVRAVATTE
ncbi:hypothetical protein ERJ75_000475000 [Trypanosoma vivax]|nr:hypothetical protein ERJ75_000475000 [Trypanosoma vivax]